MKRFVSTLLTLAVLGAGVGAYVFTREEIATYTVTADVEQAPNLFDGGRVMVRGVEVGAITKVTPTPDSVRITMEIEEGIAIPADARLSVVPITVIADRYVQFYPAYDSGPKLADGAHLGADRTTIPVELEEVLAQLKGLLDALAPRAGEKRGPLTKLVVGLDEAIDGRAGALAGTVEGSATVLENLADSGTDITALIKNLDGLFAALANRSSEIGLINERFRLVAETLAADQRNIEGTIENLTLLSEESAALVSESGDDLGKSFARLDRVLTTILAHQDSLKKGVAWANVVAQALGETNSSGQGLWAYSGRQAAPGSAAAAYNYRIDTRDTITCERIELVAEGLWALLPGSNDEDLVNSVLDFIPREYHEDIEFLIRLLLPLCADMPSEGGPPPGQATQDIVQEAARRMGEKRFMRAMSRWAVEGLLRGRP